MKALLKLILTLVIFFLSISGFVFLFDLGELFHYQNLLNSIKGAHHLHLGIAVIFLILLDLLLSIPTLALCIFTGHLLGALWGGIYVFIGLSLSGQLGFILGSQFGRRILKVILRDDSQRKDLELSYDRYASIFILLSRSIPMAPEICSLLSGMNEMKWRRFTFLWTASIVPYSIGTTFLGSIGSGDNIYVVMCLIGLCYLLIWGIGKYYIDKKTSEVVYENN